MTENQRLTIDQAFVDRFRAAIQQVTQEGVGVTETELAILRPHLEALMGQTVSCTSHDDSFDITTKRHVMAVQIGLLLLDGQIKRDDFQNLMGFLPHISLKSSVKMDKKRGPKISLRMGMAAPGGPPALFGWKDGRWGWEMILGRSITPDDMTIHAAGQAREYPMPYLHDDSFPNNDHVSSKSRQGGKRSN